MKLQKTGNHSNRYHAKRDILIIGIAVTAIILFLANSSSVLPQIMFGWIGDGIGPSALAVNAFLLNIALILFGYRRYRELNREMQHRKDAENKAKALEDTDALTGCLNRQSIGPATDQLLGSVQDDAEDIAFLLIDLDNFQQINDLHGHALGDQLICEVAQNIEQAVSDRCLLARLGGDEFACVMPYSTACPDQIDQAVSQIMSAINKINMIGNTSIVVTVSIGIATSSHCDSEDLGEDCAQTLMKRADIAMSNAKKTGKNRYTWFEESMEDRLRQRGELEAGIRRGIRENEFVPYYEQQIDLCSGKLVGFEMLARWNADDFGNVGPVSFIPVAEEMGVIAELSEMLIEQALEDAKEWAPHLTLSVNISPIQICDPWFSQKLLKLLVLHNFAPSRLEIEITESCLLENSGVVRSMITSLRNQGVKISLDDFGTGYSSLTQLRTLPFDRLKIDRSFVTDISNETSSERIVSAIIELGEGLSMPVTAEGIEDEQSLALLRAKGNLKGQGYLYGQPESASDVMLRLASANLTAKDSGQASDIQANTQADEDASDSVESKSHSTDINDQAQRKTG